MNASEFERNTKSLQDDAVRLAAPFQNFWKVTVVDLPLSVLSASMRFAGNRLHAHADHLTRLNSCQSIPEMIDTHSQYVRSSVNEFGQHVDRIKDDVRGTMNTAQSDFGKAA